MQTGKLNTAHDENEKVKLERLRFGSRVSGAAYEKTSTIYHDATASVILGYCTTAALKACQNATWALSGRTRSLTGDSCTETFTT